MTDFLLLSRADVEKRLFWLEKGMNGSYSRRQKLEMGREIVRLNKFLETAKGESSEELSENEGVKTMMLMTVFALIVVVIAVLFLYGFVGGGK